jgi:hypothetical protein
MFAAHPELLGFPVQLGRALRLRFSIIVPRANATAYSQDTL